MGLFSSKKVTTVGTAVARAIADDFLPDAVATGIAKALFSGDQLVENILEEVVAGIGVRAGNMYRYGRDTYSYGLPAGTLFSSSDGAGTVAALLESLYGVSTVVDYHQFGPLNNLHFGWKKLCEQYAYDSATNQLGTLSVAEGVPVYLKDMVVVADATAVELSNGSLKQWGLSPNSGATPERAGSSLRKATPFKVHAGVGDHLEVSYVWETSTEVVVEGVTVTRKVLNQDSFTIPVDGYDLDADYFQVKYAANGKDGYWLYELGAGTYPDVDDVFTKQQESQGSYFPISYFRYGKQSTASNPASVEFRQAKQLTDYLGMDFLQIAEAIDANPDIADVESALLMMAVPATTTNPMEQRYLYSFFDRIYDQAGSSFVTVSAAPVDDNGNYTYWFKPPPKISLVIADQRFKTVLSCDAITKVRRGGVIGKKGSYSSGWEAKTVVTQGQTTSLSSLVDHHYYRFQVSDSVYDEIQVVDLKMRYYIYEQYNAVGDDTEAILLVPLDFAITDSYQTGEKEELYARSLHYIFNSRVITKLKWYQQEWFSIVMIIVSIVLIVVTLGAYTPAATAYMAAIAAGTVALSAVMIGVFLTYILPALLMYVSFKLFVKAVGPKIALIVAVIAVIVGVGLVANNGGSFASTPWAQELLTVSNGLSQAAQTSIQEAIAGLVDEYAEFAALTETKIDLLGEANKLLENPSVMAPFIVFGEKPDDFYNRTVHAGNIGVLGLDMVASYVDTALTLPTLSETL